MTDKLLEARSGGTRRTLLRPQKQGLDAPALRRRCLRTLTKLVWETCHWEWAEYGERWKPGDFNFLILESTVSAEANLYAQIWSEPLEAVTFEVCSGEMNPGAKPLITEETRCALFEMGFTAPNGTQNFRKEVGVSSPADAEVVAEQMLRVFSEAFRYTGETPLTARLVRGERAERAVVHNSFTPEDLTKILDGAGYDTRVAPGTPPMIQVSRAGSFVAAVQCDGRKPESNLYTEFDLLTLFERPSPEQIQTLATATAGYRFIRGHQDADGDVTFRASFTTHGGITCAAIVDFVGNFELVMREIRKRLKRQDRRKPAGVRTRGNALVH